MLLAILPFYPLISFLLLIILKNRLSWVQASFLSVGAMALCASTSFILVSSLSSTQNGVITSHL